jgi:hypothetical protein
MISFSPFSSIIDNILIIHENTADFTNSRFKDSVKLEWEK